METLRAWWGGCSEPCSSSCTDQSHEVKELIQVTAERAAKRFFTNPVDTATGSRKKERLGKKGGGAKSKKGAESHNLENSNERHFGLGLLEDEYELDAKWNRHSEYGSGLKKYYNRKTQMPRAVLSISKTKIPSEVTQADIRKQLELLCKVDHPNVVPFRECFEDHSKLKLVYDWCPGGPLILQLYKFEGKFTEGHVAQVIRELLAALGAAHSFGVHHLDLSLFSIFLGFPDRLSPIKLFGLGLAGCLMPLVTQRDKSRTNKHFYIAPDLIYGKMKAMSAQMKHACDMWSVGTILFTICSGRPPFGVGSKHEVEHRILKGEYSFGIEFSQSSPTLLELIECLLEKIWQKRISAVDALHEPFLAKSATLHVNKQGQISSIALSQLNAFVAQDHITQTLARLLADIGISDDLFTKLESEFHEMDLNGDGTITLGELTHVASQLPGMTPEVIDQIVAKLDRNGNCNVDISEFIAAMVMEQEEADQRLIEKAFGKMDCNGDARVTKKELFRLLRQYSGTIETKEVSSFIGQSDEDGDQKMNIREFMHLFPQVREKDSELKERLRTCLGSIQQGHASLTNFQEAISHWKDKLTHKRDQIEIACGVQQVPPDCDNSHYSYDKGHLTEWDVQVFVLDAIDLLVAMPGYHETKAMKRQRAKDEDAMKRISKRESAILGALTLTANSRHIQEAEAAAEAEGQIDNFDALSEPGTHRASATKQHVSGLEEWTTKLADDRRVRMADPEYTAEDRVHEILYWLLKVKSDRRWQKPLVKMVQQMRDSCVEDVEELNINLKTDLVKLRAACDESYFMKDEHEFGIAEERKKIKKGARLLPLGDLKGKNLKHTVYLERMEDMHLPARFFVGHKKQDTTQQKWLNMQRTHHSLMVEAGAYITGILKSIAKLFEEVEEDLCACSALEARISCPPNMSQLFLPFCAGREVAEDAATPRSDESGSTEREGEEFSKVTASPASSKADTKLRCDTEEIVLPASPSKSAINRNSVLRQASLQRGRTAT